MILVCRREKCDVMLKCIVFNVELQLRVQTLEDTRSFLRAIQRLAETVSTYGDYKALACQS